MQKILLLALFGAALSGNAQSADIAAIKQLNEDWIHNYILKDKSVWERIFADDFMLINPAGKKFTKLDVIAAPPQPITMAKVDTAEVQIHGTIALIHARCSFTALAHGKERLGQTDYLDVYEKRAGRWWAIAAHVTYLGESSK
jgi:ketosteroid isomerase-like protein